MHNLLKLIPKIHSVDVETAIMADHDGFPARANNIGIVSRIWFEGEDGRVAGILRINQPDNDEDYVGLWIDIQAINDNLRSSISGFVDKLGQHDVCYAGAPI